MIPTIEEYQELLDYPHKVLRIYLYLIRTETMGKIGKYLGMSTKDIQEGTTDKRETKEWYGT